MTAPSAPTDIVTLTIDARELKVPKGTLVVEAARQLGIEIPVFCYHPKLKPVGACRMCLVEIEKMPRLQTACTSPVAEGMIVHTNTQNVIGAQNGVLELMLANHPLDCPICDKGGECPLQDNTFKFGLGTSRFTEEKRQLDKAFPLSERIVLDRERCIMCYRCTRFQAEIAGDEALAAVDRGGYSEIGVLEGETFDSPFSGNTIELCPVGALTSRQYRFKARPWDLQRTPSTCAGCAVGCNVELHARDGQILRMVAHDNREVNDGWLCDYGRFDTLPPLEGRVARPLVRSGGVLEAVTWDRAYARAAEVLRTGPTGLLASPGLTNEAIWLFADALRAALPEAHAGFWPRAAAPWPLRGAIKDLPACKTVVLVGLDPWVELPVLALWIRKAVLNGATLIAIGPDNGLYRDTAHWLRIPFATEVGVVQRLLEAGGGPHPLSPLPSEGEGVGERGVAHVRYAGEGASHGRAARAGREADDAAIAAAAGALGPAPSALLIHPRLTTNRSDVGVLEQLAERLGASGEGGMVGSPPLAANGRGALELAADIATVDPKIGAVATRAAADELRAVLLIGHERWPMTGRARRVLATWGPIDEQAEDVEVVLPIAHPYEQAGSLTNLEGRVQTLQAAGLPPVGVPPDWQLLADLATHLGGTPPRDLRAIRAALAEANPKYRLPEGAGGRRGRISLAVS